VAALRSAQPHPWKSGLIRLHLALYAHARSNNDTAEEIYDWYPARSIASCEQRVSATTFGSLQSTDVTDTPRCISSKTASRSWYGRKLPSKCERHVLDSVELQWLEEFLTSASVFHGKASLMKDNKAAAWTRQASRNMP